MSSSTVSIDKRAEKSKRRPRRSVKYGEEKEHPM